MALNAPSPDATPGWTIAEVERETGLAKDTLRVWERRYGFPTPERDAQGERRYDEAQVQRLRWIKRLLDHCLLYTSPSPRDRTRSRMPSSA